MSAPAAELRRATDLIDAFNEADWDRLQEQVAREVLYTETGTGRRVEGVNAYLKLCQGWKEAFPDVAGTVTHAATGDDMSVLEIRWEGTHSGPLETPGGTVPPTGKRITVDSSFWVRDDDDGIQEIHHHLDVLALLQQVGALPG